jgi:hypothetical protein
LTKARAKKRTAVTSPDAWPGHRLPGTEWRMVIERRVAHLIDTGGDHDLLVGEVINALILKEGDEQR